MAKITATDNEGWGGCGKEGFSFTIGGHERQHSHSGNKHGESSKKNLKNKAKTTKLYDSAISFLNMCQDSTT